MAAKTKPVKLPTIDREELFVHRGRTFRLDILDDDNGEAPWDQSDCHGPVTDWMSTLDDEEAEERGYLELNSDRGSARYYDMREAKIIAKRDSWGTSNREFAIPGRAKHIAAVLADYDYLRRWCNDHWRYVGAVVTHIPDGEEPGRDFKPDYQFSCWGLESDADDCLSEVARELAEEASRELDKQEAAAIGKVQGLRHEHSAHVRLLRKLGPEEGGLLRGGFQRMRKEARKAVAEVREARGTREPEVTSAAARRRLDVLSARLESTPTNVDASALARELGNTVVALADAERREAQS